MNNPHIRVETQSLIVDIGYFSPWQLKNIIVAMEKRTQFRIRSECQGYTFMVSVNGLPKTNATMIHTRGAVPGDIVLIEVQRDGDSSYSREITLLVKEDDVELQECPSDIELSLEKQTRRTQFINRKFCQQLTESDHERHSDQDL